MQIAVHQECAPPKSASRLNTRLTRNEFAIDSRGTRERLRECSKRCCGRPFRRFRPALGEQPRYDRQRFTFRGDRRPGARQGVTRSSSTATFSAARRGCRRRDAIRTRSALRRGRPAHFLFETSCARSSPRCGSRARSHRASSPATLPRAGCRAGNLFSPRRIRRCRAEIPERAASSARRIRPRPRDRARK